MVTPHAVCRIISQNVQGIHDDFHFTDIKIITDAAHSLRSDILCLSETNINWSNNNCTMRFKAATGRANKSHCQFSHNTHDTHKTNTYLPGGTAMIVSQPWASRTTSKSDPSGMGRWTEATLQGRNNKTITIINTYRVCPNTTGGHDDNTYHSQQWRHMLSPTNLKPDPRQQTLDDLSHRISELQHNNSAIIITIDANEHLYQTSHRRLPQWIQHNNLTDIHTHMHGQDNEPETQKRGKHRIDFIFVSPDIIDYITASGILPYNTLGKGDHRPLYIDIQLSHYLRDQPSPSEQRPPRILTTDNPRAVKQYRLKLTQFLDDSPFEADMLLLQSKMDNIEGTLPPDLQQEYNRLDTLLTSTCLTIEQSIGDTPNKPWSPQLMEAKHMAHYWSMWVSELRTGVNLHQQRQHYNNKVPTGRINRINKTITRFKLSNTTPTLSEAHKQLRDAKRTLQSMTCKSFQIRQEHLRIQALAHLEHGNDDIEAIIRKIQHKETQRRSTSRIRSLIKPTRKGLSSILIDTKNGQEHIFNKDEIFHHITERNIIHLAQASGTPFTTDAITSILGPYSTSLQSQQILDGQYDVSTINTTKAARDILMMCTRLSPANSVSSFISTSDFRQGMKRWRESTTTSPSKLHLGHAKAIMKFESHLAPDDPQRLSERIFSFQANLLNNAIRHTFIPHRWQQVHDIMIEKSPGNPYLPKLRTITISEKDENLLSGIILGRRMIYQGESISAFGNEQGGSRPDRETAEVSLFKHTMFSISRLTHTELISFDNDAKSCFDRITMNLASLAAQRLGVDPKTCELILQILNSRQHRVVTQHGESPLTYQHSPDNPLYGPSQGSKDAAAIWVTLSTILMEGMTPHNSGASFTDPRQGITVQQRMTGFVDDTTHWLNSFFHLDSTLFQQIHHIAQAWEELLHASGGKLELTKCFIYHIRWTTNEKNVMVMDHTTHQQPTIITDSSTHEAIAIHEKPTNESHKTLGIIETPSGNNADEYNRLKMIALKFARIITTNALSYNDSRNLYYTYFLPSISYALTVGTFTEKQLHNIQSPATFAILPSLGMNRHTDRAVAFGPTNIGGKGLRHLFAEQGTLKVLTLMKYIRTPRPLGNLLLIRILWEQRIAGIGHSILTSPFTHCPQLTELWMTTIREFLNKSELEIIIPALYHAQHLRTHDTILMDNIKTTSHKPDKHLPTSSNTSFSNSAHIIINNCRLYLHAATLSDITNAAGTHIQPHSFHCTTHGQLRSSELWPHIPTPSKPHIKIWQEYISTMCKTDTLQLLTPLGPWLRQPVSQQQWTAYYSATALIGYVYNDNTWTQYSLHPLSRHGYCTNRLLQHYPSTLPPDLATLQIGDISPLHHNQWLIHPSSYCQSHIESTPPDADLLPESDSAFRTYIHNIPSWEREIIQNTKFLQHPTIINQHLLNPDTTITAVSDGGHIDKFGSFGWIIATPTTCLIENHGAARGTPMSSYRAEAYGKLSWIIFIKHYLQHYSITPLCTFDSYLDNLAIVRHTTFHSSLELAKHALCADHDILAAIHQEQQILRSRFTKLTEGQHVKGHQDSLSAHHTLSRPAQLNIMADSLATTALNIITTTNSYLPTTPTPHCSIYLRSNGHIITSKEKTLLRWKWSELQLQQYYTTRLNLSYTQLHSLNWAALHNAKQSLSTSQQNFAIKLLTRWLPTKTVTSKYGNIITTCHRCQQPEIIHHIFTCPDNKKNRQDYILEIDAALTTRHTLPILQQSIIHGLCHYTQLYTLALLHPSHQSCYTSQSTFGWDQFASGLLIQHWSQHQQQYINTTDLEHKTLLGDTWNKHISKAILLAAHKLWITRCTEIHGPSTDPNTNKTIAQLYRIYDLARTLTKDHQTTLFNIPIEHHIARGTKHITQWIRRNAKTIKILRHSKHTRKHHGQLTLTKF